MRLPLFTSVRGDYVSVERSRLRDDLGLRIFLGVALVWFVVVSVLTYFLETSL